MGILAKLGAGILCVALLAGSVSVAAADVSFNQVFAIKDWGPATTKLIVDLGKPVNATAIDADAFKVVVKKTDARLPEPLVGEGERKVLAAYISDAEGNPADSGNFVTLAMSFHPDDPLSSPMNYDMMGTGFNAWVDCTYTITQQKPIGDVTGLVATKVGTTFRPEVDRFNLTGVHAFADPDRGEIKLSYASYKPVGAYAGEKLPLIIWLHGAGEGGTDPSLTIAANRACNFASPEIQAYFGGRAFVLAPQAPTMWMDDGSGDPYGQKTENKSIYTAALFDLIRLYVEANPAIDLNRIYLGGDSNGGFMTMVMITTYPETFAAAFPTCEAAPDANFTDAQIAGIQNLPIWFVQAADDPVVPGAYCAVATYARLLKLGAENVWLSLPKHVEDPSGQIKNAEGKPYRYFGHAVWQLVYTNDLSQQIDGKTVTIMEWLAAQSK